jgi:hypothetical protein
VTDGIAQLLVGIIFHYKVLMAWPEFTPGTCLTRKVREDAFTSKWQHIHPNLSNSGRKDTNLGHSRNKRYGAELINFQSIWEKVPDSDL